MKRETSFGTLEVIATQDDGQPLSERLMFLREGRDHSHDRWEICHVISGGGTITVGDKVIEAQPGQICLIPPQTGHWMSPDPHMEVILLYSVDIPRLP